MDARRVLILHGWQGSGEGHWQRWLAAELEAAGETVLFPDLPECDLPCPDQWGGALHQHLAALADGPGERVVIAHSLGVVLWLREAARVRPGHRVDRVALVAPPCPGAAVAELAGFYPSHAQAGPVAAAARGATRLVCADDDPYCPAGAQRHWAGPLELVVDLLPGQGHLNVEAGYGPWPAMLAWARGEADRITAAA